MVETRNSLEIPIHVQYVVDEDLSPLFLYEEEMFRKHLGPMGKPKLNSSWKASTHSNAVIFEGILLETLGL